MGEGNRGVGWWGVGQLGIFAGGGFSWESKKGAG